VKTRTALVIAVVGIGIFVAAEIGKRNGPVQNPGTSSPVRVVQYADPKVKVKAEPTLPTDPAAKQRVIDAELNRAVKRAIDVEQNRAIARALSDASEDDLKHHSDQ
jgi:hypothetical protein